MDNFINELLATGEITMLAYISYYLIKFSLIYLFIRTAVKGGVESALNSYDETKSYSKKSEDEAQ
jgi:hypothetical protein